MTRANGIETFVHPEISSDVLSAQHDMRQADAAKKVSTAACAMRAQLRLLLMLSSLHPLAATASAASCCAHGPVQHTICEASASCMLTADV